MKCVLRRLGLPQHRERTGTVPTLREAILILNIHNSTLRTHPTQRNSAAGITSVSVQIVGQCPFGPHRAVRTRRGNPLWLPWFAMANAQ